MNKSYRYGWQESLAGILMLICIAAGFYQSWYVGMLVIIIIAVTHTWMWWLYTQELDEAKQWAAYIAIDAMVRQTDELCDSFLGPENGSPSLARAIRDAAVKTKQRWPQ